MTDANLEKLRFDINRALTNDGDLEGGYVTGFIVLAEVKMPDGDEFIATRYGGTQTNPINRLGLLTYSADEHRRGCQS